MTDNNNKTGITVTIEGTEPRDLFKAQRVAREAYRAMTTPDEPNPAPAPETLPARLDELPARLDELLAEYGVVGMVTDLKFLECDQVEVKSTEAVNDGTGTAVHLYTLDISAEPASIRKAGSLIGATLI
jgi:hypothetical protein